MKISDTIKKARESHGFTQQQLADKVGCSLDTISRLELDYNNKKIELIEKIFEVLAIGLKNNVKHKNLE